jgi:hypothetical protein
MTLTGSLTVLMAFVSSAILSRPKLPELELDSKERQIAELRRELDHAREDYDTMRRENAMLRGGLIESEARVAVLRSNAKRSQAPQHLPVPAPLTSAEAQRLGAQALERLMQLRVGPLMSELEPGSWKPLIPMRPPAPLTEDLQRAMQQMDAFICNCAPGRHQLFVTSEGDAIFGDDTL